MIRLCAFSDEASRELKGQIAALLRNGISLTELRSVGKKNVKDLTTGEAKEVRKELNGSGISVWSVGSPLGKVDLAADFNAYLDTVKHVCELAVVLGTDKVRAFSFYHAYQEPQKVYDRLNRMAEVAEEYGVTLYHENEKEIYGDTADRVLAIMENVRGWKYVYDPANFIQVGEKAERTLSLLHSKTDYFHIKDVIASTGELVPAGYGDGKIAELIDAIADDKVLTIEPHLALFDAYASIDGSEMKHKFTYKDGNEAFDAAVSALKNLLKNAGYRKENGAYIK